MLFLVAALTAIDQFIKMTVITNLKPIGSITCIPGLLEFTYIENTGAAFGFFSGFSWVIMVLTMLLSLALLVFLFRYKHHTFLSNTACILVVAGGIGNLIDRVVNGYVVDMIALDFMNFAVFNVADIFVTGGAVVLVVYALLIDQSGKKKEKSE